MRHLLFISAIFLMAFSPVRSSSRSPASSPVPDWGVTVAAATTYSGIQIILPSNKWVGVTDVSVIPSGVSDIMTSMSSATGVQSMGSLLSGEYGTNSGYNSLDSNWNDTDWDAGTETTLGTIHWSASSSSGIEIYHKFSSPSTLSRYMIKLKNVPVYGLPNVTFKDDLGNTITPVSSPSGASDYIGTDAINSSYEWVF